MSPAPEDLDARIARYEAWRAKLEATRADYLRRHPLYQKGFFALTAAGFACFAVSLRAGVWGAGCAVFVSVAGWFMLKTRVWELDVELGEIRDELSRLTPRRRR